MPTIWYISGVVRCVLLSVVLVESSVPRTWCLSPCDDQLSWYRKCSTTCLVLRRRFVKRKCVVYYLVQQQNVKRGKKYFSWAASFYDIFRFIECRPRQVLLYLFHRFSLVSSITVWETCVGVFSISSSQQWYISYVKRILLDHKLKL